MPATTNVIIIDVEPETDNWRRVCTYCGIAKEIAAFYIRPQQRRGRSTRCKECSLAISRSKQAQTYAARRAKMAADPVYAEKVRADQRVRSRSPEQRARNKISNYLSRQRHLARRNALSRARYRQNIEKSRQRAREVYHRKKKKPLGALAIRSYKLNRRARENQTNGRSTEAQISNIRKLQRNRCAVCRLKLTNFHIDHITPLARGGSNWPSNLQLLCPDCNRAKGARDPVEFMQTLGRLL